MSSGQATWSPCCTTPDAPQHALAMVKAECDARSDVDDTDHLRPPASRLRRKARVSGESGDLEAGKTGRPQDFETSYLNSYVAHAAMEPTRRWPASRTARRPSGPRRRPPSRTQDRIAQALGFAAERAGHRALRRAAVLAARATLQAIEAARLAKIVGSRSRSLDRGEEFFYDTFRPAAVVNIRSGIDDAGRLPSGTTSYFAGERGATQFYSAAISTRRAAVAGAIRSAHPFAVGPGARPVQHQHLCARIAHRPDGRGGGHGPARVSPEESDRPAHAPRPPGRGRAFGWTPGEAPERARAGVACGTDAGTYVAAYRRGRGRRKTGR